MSIEHTSTIPQASHQTLSKASVNNAFASNGSSLGTTTGIVSGLLISENIKRKQSSNIRKWTLKKYAEQIMPATRQSYCMKHRGNEDTDIKVYYDDNIQNAHYQGLAHCDNVWLCPVCSATIATRRANEITQAINSWHGATVMFTYTMRHKRHDDPKELTDKLRTAYRKLWKDRFGQNMKAKLGWFGAITALEVTYGDVNGWHIHIHQLLFLDPKKAEIDVMDDNVIFGEVNDQMSRQWVHCLQSVDAEATIANGFMASAGDQFRREYVAKFGREPKDETWNLSDELTKSNLKRSKAHGVETGLHPFQILEKSKGNEKSKHGKLWKIYEKFTKHRNQLSWSQGLKSALGIDDLTDDEVIKEADEEIQTKECVTEIPYPLWQGILYFHQRGKLLNHVIKYAGNTDEVRSWLRDLYCRYLAVLREKERLREAEHLEFITGTIWDTAGNSMKFDGRLPEGYRT